MCHNQAVRSGSFTQGRFADGSQDQAEGAQVASTSRGQWVAHLLAALQPGGTNLGTR